MEPVPFHLERSSQVLTRQAGVALVGSSLECFARVSQHIDPVFPVNVAVLPNSTLLKTYLGLLCQGKSDDCQPKAVMSPSVTVRLFDYFSTHRGGSLARREPAGGHRPRPGGHVG